LGALLKNGGDGQGSHATIEYCVIQNNYSVYEGAGLHNCDGLIRFNTIQSNTTYDGAGGLTNCNGVIDRNTIASNYSEASGAGALRFCTTIRANIIRDNGSEYWAGAIEATSATIINNVIVGNYVWDGEYVINLSSTGLFANNTICSNNAYTLLTETRPTVRNCIIYANNAYWPGGGQTNYTGDPKFVNAAAGNYHLRFDSPCINAGTTVTGVTSDIDGHSRPQGGAFDIGADEYYNAPPVVSFASPPILTWPQNRVTLSATVTDDGNTTTPHLTWSKAAGLGDVAFSTPTARGLSAATEAVFTRAGTYSIRLAAFDGEKTSSPTVQVIIRSGAPIVSAGPDRTVVLPPSGSVVVRLSGIAYDDTHTSAELGYTWYGPSFYAATAETDVTITAPGTYTYTLYAYEPGTGLQGYDSVTVTVIKEWATYMRPYPSGARVNRIGSCTSDTLYTSNTTGPNWTYMDCINDITTDSAGNIYVTGYLVMSSSLLGNEYKDMFVAKVTPDGSQCVWQTIVGNNLKWDEGLSLDLDATGNVVLVVGTVASAGLQSTGKREKSTGANDTDLYFLALNVSNGTRITSEYFGGGGDEFGVTDFTRMQWDTLQNSIWFVGGTTYSNDATVRTSGAKSHPDAFLAQVQWDGSSFGVVKYNVMSIPPSLDYRDVQDIEIRQSSTSADTYNRYWDYEPDGSVSKRHGDEPQRLSHEANGSVPVQLLPGSRLVLLFAVAVMESRVQSPGPVAPERAGSSGRKRRAERCGNQALYHVDVQHQQRDAVRGGCGAVQRKRDSGEHPNASAHRRRARARQPA
jgi:hypothetical protein